MYMTGSTVGKVDRAKSIIAGAITGLVLLLCSYLLLSIIDPTAGQVITFDAGHGPGSAGSAGNDTTRTTIATTKLYVL